MIYDDDGTYLFNSIIITIGHYKVIKQISFFFCFFLLSIINNLSFYYELQLYPIILVIIFNFTIRSTKFIKLSIITFNSNTLVMDVSIYLSVEIETFISNGLKSIIDNLIDCCCF